MRYSIEQVAFGGVLVAGALFVLSRLATEGPPDNWLYHYQTLWTGIIALFSVLVYWEASKKDRETVEESERRRAKELATAIIGEMTANRFLIRNVCSDENFLSVMRLLKQGYPVDANFSTKLFDALAPEIGQLGSERTRQVIYTYIQAEAALSGFLKVGASFLDECEIEDGTFVIQGPAKVIQDRLRFQVDAHDVFLLGMCNEFGIRCEDAVRKNAELQHKHIEEGSG